MTVPLSIATPVAIWPLAKALSNEPSWPLAFKPSTSHASVAPLKNVRPRPRSIETAAQAKNGAWICHMSRYRSVAPVSVAEPSR